MNVIRKIIPFAFILLAMSSCYTSKAVISNDANISKYKYVVFGKEMTGDRILDDVVIGARNCITEAGLKTLSSSDYLKISQCSDSLLTPNIHVTSEQSGSTYITITFYDYKTDLSVAVVKSSGIGITVSQDHDIALNAIKKKLTQLFGN